MYKNFAGVIEPGSNEDTLLKTIDPERLPRHIAIIMDGNGRWAKQRGKPRIFGHRAGAESVRAIVDTGARLGIEVVTLFAFSTENWKRPRTEVSGLMSMLKKYIRSEIAEVHRNNIRFRPIGDIDALEPDVRQEIRAASEKTLGNTGMILNVALNYGGRQEIIEACKKAAASLIAEKRNIGSLSESDFCKNLYTSGLPDVDLLIRTSGEMRISNFLLWQIAYAEIVVTPTLFPDFRRRHIFEAILDYQKRDRRFGGVSSK